LDRDGHSRPDWDEALGEALSGPPATQAGSSSISEALRLSGFAMSTVSHRGRRLGALAIALPESTAPEIATLELTLLGEFARQLALILTLERNDDEVRALRELQAEQRDLCDIGIISGGISHEFLNVLNNISLQVAVLQKQVPGTLHPGLAVIHEHGRQAGAILRSLQQYRQNHQASLYPLNLNRLIHEEFAKESQAPRLELTADLPPVLGTASELTILLRLLLSNVGLLIPGGHLVIQTGNAPKEVILHVVAQGPGIATDILEGLFEPLGKGQEIVPRLELAGCQQIVRRWQGILRAENFHAGGLAFVVELPAAAEAKLD
jgi:signal transduction histidine kinase